MKGNKPLLRKKDIRTYKNDEGAWVCFAVVGLYLQTYRFYFYTKREAIDEFYRKFAFGNAQQA